MSNYLAFCEVYESKPALYFSDDDFYIKKIGSFVTSEYNLSIGTLEAMSNGDVSTPLGFSFSQPLKVGDIVQVTLVNYYQGSMSFPNITLGDSVNFILGGNRLRSCFVVGSIEGRRLVLKDYVEYNHSYTTVGYVGQVKNERLLNIMALLSQREMRAFASRLYTFRTENGNIKLPFGIHASVKNFETSFSDDFTRTNVKPFDVISLALKNAKNPDNLYINDAIRVSSTVEHDGRGYYVLQYVMYNSSLEDISLRIKPGVDINTTPGENADAVTIWIQPDENADDYIRCGVVVGVKKPDGSVSLKSINEVSASDYQGYGITSGKTLLVGYSNLFDSWYKLPDDVGKNVTDDVADEDIAGEDAKTNVDLHSDELKNDLGKPITFETIKSLLPKVIDSGFTPIQKYTGGDINPTITAVNVAAASIRESVQNEIKGQYTPLTIEVSDTDFYSTNVDLSGEENITLWYNSPMGGAINGLSARCKSVRYTNTGRVYTIETTPYRGKVIR